MYKCEKGCSIRVTENSARLGNWVCPLPLCKGQLILVANPAVLAETKK